jgi:putative ABC transport system permease protein
MAFYLAFKEVWRNLGRYMLFSLVIALITVLVLFIAALAGGLANANKQLIEKLDADFLVYQENTDLQVTSSRLNQEALREVRRIPGVAEVGPLGFASATIIFDDGREPLDISIVGVEPGKPGDPALLEGTGLRSRRNNDAVIDISIAQQAGLTIGDRFTLKTVQGTDEELFQLAVVGITDERQYFFLPAAFMPLDTWDKVKPQAAPSLNQEAIYNILAVRLDSADQAQAIRQTLSERVSSIEVTDKQTAIEALPGYSAQQSTLNTQQAFTLLIGVLVVGGFFQIQTLQKVAQIGVLKAIGSSSGTVALTVLLQIILVTIIGVGIGAVGTLLLSLGLPGNVPIMFTGASVIGALSLLLLIGPLGGLVSIRLALRIDPLTAIGLSS